MKKNLKKVFIIVFCAIISVSLCSCAEYAPEESVSYVLDAFKSGDEEAVGNLFEKGDSLSGLEGEYNEAFKIIFANMDYEIVSSTENGNKASVIVKITNKDYGDVAKKAFKKFESYAMNNPDASQKDLQKKIESLLLEEINKVSQSNSTVTNKVEFTLTKDEESDWIIDDPSDEVMYAMSGNLLKGIDEM